MKWRIGLAKATVSMVALCGLPVSTAAGARSAGGRVAATLGPWDKWEFSVSAGGEFICNRTILSDSGCMSNSSIFRNIICQHHPSAKIRVEVSRWLTEYHG